MQHFEREAKWMAAVVGLFVAAAVGAASVVPHVLTRLDIDHCLDAGGAYHRGAAQCFGAAVLPKAAR